MLLSFLLNLVKISTFISCDPFSLSCAMFVVFECDVTFFWHPILDTRISVSPPPPSHSYYPSWNMKQAGLESSGRIAFSLYWKTKIISFFSVKKKFQLNILKWIFFILRFCQIFRFFYTFLQFQSFCGCLLIFFLHLL